MAIHSRSVSEALYELGKDKTYNPSYTGRAMQPLEAVRHFASNDILSRTRWMGEPPALLHGSKYGSGHFLYGTEVPAVHEDVAYRDGNAPPQEPLFEGFNTTVPCENEEHVWLAGQQEKAERKEEGSV